VIKEVEIETDGTRTRTLLHPKSLIKGKALEKMVESVDGLEGAVSMLAPAPVEAGEAWLCVNQQGAPDLWLAPGAFAQGNLGQNSALASLAGELSGLSQGESGLDLYCGAGNHSLPLAAKKVAMSGVDLSPAAIASAERSRMEAGLSNIQFTREKCLDAVEGFSSSGIMFDSVILNPPRAGASGVFEKALALARNRAVYVACDPATLARDGKLAFKAGFALSRVEVMDMFPMTSHVETVALFERIS